MASFRKLSSGRWRAEVARQGVRDSGTFATKTAAREWAARREYEIVHADAVQAQGVLADLLNRYAREVSPSKRGARWEMLRLEMFQKDPISRIRLSDLRPQDFASWRDRRARDVAPGSVRREMGLMSTVLNLAVREWGALSVNPMAQVSRPPAPAARDRRPTAKELDAMLLAAGNDLTHKTARAFHAFLFAIETAMRAGEIVRLTADNVDADLRVAHLPMTKNGLARDVPLSSRAIALLAALPDADPLFDLTSPQLDALFRKVRDRACVQDLTFHDSRHEAITRLSKKLDVLALARMVGHRDLRQLQVYYNESAAELAKRLD